MLKKLIVEYYRKQRECITILYNQLDDFYSKYHYVFKIILIAAVMTHAIKWLDYKHNYYFNQEVFDLNNVPSGRVIWLYPKNKKLNPVLPDSLKKNFNITDDPIRPDEYYNYNIDTWIIAIKTPRGQIVKIEVPDYAIYEFELHKEFKHEFFE